MMMGRLKSLPLRVSDHSSKHLLTCAEESMKHNVFLPVEEE